ncbi:MAG: WecB/TagA/CpsF family glycosyltransferase [Candidatus Sumerlaeia bacterium]|nr:WecB/TagA/CpsF family glycosyltransferase [Candidatus Sumerlaeia bacterium]
MSKKNITAADSIPIATVLGLPVARLTVAEFIERVSAAASERRGWRIAYVNAANFNLAGDNPEFAETLRSFDLVYADGQAVVWASRFLGDPVPERVNAGDFIEQFCAACARRTLRVYLLGSKPDVAERAAQYLSARVAGVHIVGCHHGHFDLADSPRIAAEIARRAPDVVLVGMGAPRQEFWTAEHAASLNAGVVWCVGALFDYLAGETPRAPVWMRRVGLEWLFRLAVEPRRLWRRYLIGNWRFLWRVLCARRNRCG